MNGEGYFELTPSRTMQCSPNEDDYEVVPQYGTALQRFASRGEQILMVPIYAYSPNNPNNSAPKQQRHSMLLYVALALTSIAFITGVALIGSVSNGSFDTAGSSSASTECTDCDTGLNDQKAEITELKSSIQSLEQFISLAKDDILNYELRTDAQSTRRALQKKIDDVTSTAEASIATDNGRLDAFDDQLDAVEAVKPGTTNLINSDTSTWKAPPADVVLTQFRDGRMIKAMRSKEKDHTKCYGTHSITHLIPADPSKTYEFSIWLKSDGSDLRNFFGYYLYDADKVKIDSYWENVYFKDTRGDVDEWVRINAFLLPSWTRPDGGPTIAENQVATASHTSHVMSADTGYVVLRFRTCYGDGKEENRTLWAFPSVTVVHDALPFIRDRSPIPVHDTIDINGNVDISNGGVLMNGALQFQHESVQGHLNVAYMIAGNGEPVGIDEYFQKGTNGLQLYNSWEGCALNMTLRIGVESSPNRHGNVIEFSAAPNTCDGIDPDYGGFYDYTVSTHNNTVFVQRFAAKLPVGYSFHIHSNSIESNSQTYFMTDDQGTGSWEYYVIVREFSDNEESGGSTGHVTVHSDTGSTEPITWHLSAYQGYHF